MPTTTPILDGLPSITSDKHHAPDSSYSANPKVCADNLGYWIDDEPPADANYRIPSATFEDIAVTQAVIPNGLPVLDGSKLPAYPPQEELLDSVERFALTSAPDFFGTYEPRLHLFFEHANRQFFDGRIPRVHIKIGTCRSPRSTLGFFRTIGDHGLTGEIVLNIGLFTKSFPGYEETESKREGFFLFLKDVLLHEMTHAYCHLVLNQPDRTYFGHGPNFTNECNRIGKILGLCEVRSKWNKKIADADKPACNYWPHCLRGEEYYHGAIDLEKYWKSKEKKHSKADQKPDDLIDLVSLFGESVDASKILVDLIHCAQQVRFDQKGCRQLASVVVMMARRFMGKNKLDQHPSNKQLLRLAGDELIALTDLNQCSDE